MKRRLDAFIRDKTLLSDGFLKLFRYDFEVEKHEGGTQHHIWEMMERGDAVAVLGYDPARNEVVLVNEFRPGALVNGDYPFIDNLVAGVVGKNESALDAAAREMREEAGLELRSPVLVHPGAYVSSGGTSERIAIVFGFVDTSRAGGVHGSTTESEDILSVVLPAEEFIARAHRGEINDLKTCLAAYWLAEHLRSQRSPRDAG